MRGYCGNLYLALNENGRVITLEFVPNEDRVSPASADFALVMLATTPAGDAYTFNGTERLCSAMPDLAIVKFMTIPDSKERAIVTHNKVDAMEPRFRTAKTFIYVVDPMCSWCWGFSPVLEQIKGAV